MEAKTNKTMEIKPAETKKSGASKVGKTIGIIILCLFILSIIMLFIVGDWISLGFIATLLIASINVPTTPMSEEEQQKRYEQNRKLAERISLM